MTRDYLEAYRMREKRENEKKSWTMWEQGLYVYEAICDVAPILRAFSKSTKPLPYPKKPYELEEIQKEDKNMKELQEERDKYRAQIFFKNWADAQKKRFKDKK